MRSIVFRSCWLAASGVVAVTGAIAACSGKSPAERGDSLSSEPDATAGLESISTGAREPVVGVAAGRGEVGPGEDPIAGIEASTLPALATAPQFNYSSQTLTVNVAAGELAMIGSDVAGECLVNGATVIDSSSGHTCLVGHGNLAVVTVTETATDASTSGLTTELIIDYTNGVFAPGSASGGISVTFSGNEPTLLGIKGTTQADSIIFGATGAAINQNAYQDITWGSSANGGISTFVVSMGAGDDTWYAGGVPASADTGLTLAAFSNAAPAFPVAGYGPGVVVYGGPGNDTFQQGTASTPNETLYGGGQYGDTVDYSQRSGAVNVTLAQQGVATTISGECAAPGSTDAGIPSGAGCVTDENDDVKNDIFIVHGGSGDDFLAAYNGVLTNNLGGGAGDAGASDAGASDAHASDAASDAHASDAAASDAGASDAHASDAASDAHASDAAVADAASEAASDAGAAPSIVLTLVGNDGNDTLTPYGGPYLLQGGNGNDTFVMGAESTAHGTGTLQGGAGIDFIDFSLRTNALNIDMTGVAASGEVGEGVTISNDIENVHSGSGNDTILGNSLDNDINGGLGADTMHGNGGTDTADYRDRTTAVYVVLDGTAHSGAGTFSQHQDSAAPWTAGYCTFTSSSEGDTVAPDFANILGGSGADCLLAQPAGVSADCTAITTGNNPNGNTCQNTLTGGGGVDMLFGFDQDDVLEGAGEGDLSGSANYLDCGGGFANVGHDIGTGYKANCQF